MIHISEGSFKDTENRSVQFRGINLGGSSKLPFGTYSHDAEERSQISFVGRPFALEEADEHFTRLKLWGFNLIRFVVTWEAIEHAGRGQYDTAYLNYVTKLLEKASEYGFYIYIDPHQDVWSRYCGGDGAPAWTLELAGFDLKYLASTGAATLHAVHGIPYPHMIWGTNYSKLASATMFTLFWAGRDLAPKTRVEGTSIQEVLQESYIAAFSTLASYLKHIPTIIGYGIMNEPSQGFIGAESLAHKAHGFLKLGPSPSIIQAMGLGSGLSQNIEIWGFGLRGLKLKHFDTFNKQKFSAWQENTPPVWQDNGVWQNKNGKIEILRHKHFSEIAGRKINFYSDYYIPFAQRFISAVEDYQPESIFFLEGIPADKTMHWQTTTDKASSTSQIVHAPHWYDVGTLISKRYFERLSYDFLKEAIIWRKERIEQAFSAQLEMMKEVSKTQMNGVPTLIGEVGIPMDLHKAKAFRSGIYKPQIQAMDRSIRLLEDNLLSYCIWNYTADNSHEHGDGWNAEDFSIYSKDTAKKDFGKHLPQAEYYQGGRALAAFLRPYAPVVAGTVSHMSFDLETRQFVLCFHHDSFEKSDSNPITVIHLPNYHYPKGGIIEISDGEIVFQSKESQEIHYRHSNAQNEHRLEIRPRIWTEKT